MREDDALEDCLDLIEEHTKLSRKQARAYIYRKHFDLTYAAVADRLDLASEGSAGSYVTRARNKIKNAQKEIEALEDEIEVWEKTEALGDIETEEPSLERLRDELERTYETDGIYLVRYIRDGEERVNIHYGAVSKMNVEVLETERLADPTRLFDR